MLASVMEGVQHLVQHQVERVAQKVLASVVEEVQHLVQNQVERVVQKVLASVVEGGVLEGAWSRGACSWRRVWLRRKVSQRGVSWPHIIVGSWPNDLAIKKEVEHKGDIVSSYVVA